MRRLVFLLLITVTQRLCWAFVSHRTFLGRQTTYPRLSALPYPDSPLGRNIARTCVRNFLTQRSVQSFIFHLTQCRDPHTVKFMEDIANAHNLLEFHGTGALNMTRFPEWDSFLFELLDRPKDVVVVSCRRRGRGQGGWSKNNPYLKDRFVEFEIDINPPSLASRIISVREQLAKEWVNDLDIVLSANEMILGSYLQKALDAREEKEERKQDDAPPEEEGIDVASLTAPYSGKPLQEVAFERTAMYMFDNFTSFNDHTDTSSPLRKGNFDLLFLLATQESIHRVLRELQQAGSEREVSFQWLREFYTERVRDYFDGNQPYGRADDFLEELLLTPPSMKQTDDNMMGLIDPLRIAERIIRERSDVAREWKEIVSQVPEDHMGVRKALLSRQMSSFGQQSMVTETEKVEGGDFE